MFDTEAHRNILSARSSVVKKTQSRPKSQPIGTIMRRTQIPGVPTSMKMTKDGGSLSTRIKKIYNFESIDIGRILETSLTSSILSDQAMYHRAIERARSTINARTSLASKLSNTRRSISSKSQKLDPIYRPTYSPNEPKIEKDKTPNWSSRG